MSERIRGSYDDALHKSTYTLLLLTLSSTRPSPAVMFVTRKVMEVEIGQGTVRDVITSLRVGKETCRSWKTALIKLVFKWST